MKHHRAKAPFEAVQWARYWYDNSTMGYHAISELLSDIYKMRIAPSTVRDWIHELRAAA